jgi:hypothetical protein
METERGDDEKGGFPQLSSFPQPTQPQEAFIPAIADPFWWLICLWN